MAVLTVIPATDVKLNDVRDTLNANGGSVNNDLSTFFTDGTQSRQRWAGDPLALVTYYPNANINKWSKWKPIPCAGIELTQSLIADNKAGFYNLTIAGGGLRTLWGIFEHAVQVYDPSFEQFEWLYRVPTGGTSEPFRLGDFRNYAPASTPIVRIYDYSVEKPWNVKQYFPQEHFYYALHIGGIGNTITKSDIKINGTLLTNWKLGIMMIQDIYYNSSESKWDGTVSFIKAVEPLGAYSLEDFAALDSIENGAIVFFMSPREIPEEIQDPAGLMDVLDEQDYLLLHHTCYPFTLFNGKDSVITLWEYTSLPFASTLWYQAVVTGPINNLTWASGHGYLTLRHGAWLEDEVGVNQFAVQVIINVSGMSAGYSGNILAYASEYNAETLTVTQWEYIFIHGNAGGTFITLNRNNIDDTPIQINASNIVGSIISFKVTNFAQTSGETVFDGVYISVKRSGQSDYDTAIKISTESANSIPVPLFMFGNLPDQYDGTERNAILGCTYTGILIEGVAVEPLE